MDYSRSNGEAATSNLGPGAYIDPNDMATDEDAIERKKVLFQVLPFPDS